MMAGGRALFRGSECVGELGSLRGRHDIASISLVRCGLQKVMVQAARDINTKVARFGLGVGALLQFGMLATTISKAAFLFYGQHWAGSVCVFV
jgi:hypothetical protein